tara:strand:+ start:583 stop:1065 length:483 start_codon:yes stop_codon:yes gene_type:complete
MGYKTVWEGFYNVLDKNGKQTRLPKKVADLIIGLSNTRRMKRDTRLLAKRLYMSKEKCERLYGQYGERYIEKDYETTFGQTNYPEILNYNQPPPNQPSLWCDFTYNRKSQVIEWKESEKTREGLAWIRYIINLVQSHGYDLNGHMKWQGEEEDDKGDLYM